MLTSERILNKIEQNSESIKKYGAERVGLFGSYIKNKQTDKSDIDIVVEFERGRKTFDNYMGLKFFLEDLLGYKVDLVIAEAIKPGLKSYILNDVKYAEGV
ncbi:MAG: nucleotidyltransferase [Candidatus Altiarchaeales archaeon WOR_SM1_86-2]|nr:MAG: nucleotidyltransferase [Candidatus Altiarchaeales archaeon WOR_SM1_86-2]